MLDLLKEQSRHDSSVLTGVYLIIYNIRVLILLLAAWSLVSCKGIFNNNNNDDDSSVVLEIKRNTTYFDRDTTDGLAGFNIFGTNYYDISNTTKTLSLYNQENDYSSSTILISAVRNRLGGVGGGGIEKVFLHTSLPAKVSLCPIYVSKPDSMLITSLDDERVTFILQDSSITLSVSSNWIWIDSMYVQTTPGGELFAVDSLEFINHGLLNIELIK